MKDVHILLVEDNEGDILLITEALEDGKIVNKISSVKDGEAALKFLHQQPPYTDAELPDLILLDINLPKLNGHEVLKSIKNDDKLKRIPVIMLTTSSSSDDVLKSYGNYVNCYITKPVEVNNFLNVVTKIENFFMKIVQLPSDKI